LEVLKKALSFDRAFFLFRLSLKIALVKKRLFS
jgi:hypothetical protein